MNIDWDFNLLESLIQDRGDKVIHELAALCPACQADDPYASTVDLHGRPALIRTFYCPTCEGNGYIYRNPRQIIGLTTSINPGNVELTPDGIVSPGDAIFSPSLRAGEISIYDRITFCNASSADCSQIVMRGAATFADNKELKTNLEENEDRLNYIASCALWCEDQNGIIYQQGADYSFSGNRIVWINSPDVGTIYTIKYKAKIEWIAYSSSLDRFDNGRSLAPKIVLKKKHVHLAQRSRTSTPQERAAAAGSEVKII